MKEILIAFFKVTCRISTTNKGEIKMLKVGIIFGGESVEHEVSIITAVQAMSYLDGDKYRAIPIYIGKDRNWYTVECLKSMETYNILGE